MVNKIDTVFARKNGLKLMTHVVAGYPSINENIELIHAMAENGADLVEIQIPFSDPLADGPTIMRATQNALNNGITPDDCFKLAEQLNNIVNIPLLIMSYINIPFNMGIESFVTHCAGAGISGLIVPDIPYDEQDDDYFQIVREKGIHPIQVVSPDVQLDRLKKVVDVSSGFIYSTLKVGITGARQQVQNSGLLFLETIQKYTKLPIAAGFGISSPEHVKQLAGKADAAVVGSYIINLFEQQGLKAVSEFIKQCKTETINATDKISYS